MVVGDVLYVVAMVVFVYLTFGIVRNYYKNKFDEDGHRIDMHDDSDDESLL